MASESSTATLMQALEFTPDDLAANRAGHLSARQLQRLARLRQRSIIVGVLLIIAVGLVATVLLFLGQRNGSGILTVVGIGVTICNAALAGVLLRNWLRLSADISAKQAQALEGPVTHTIRIVGRVPAYILKVEARELQVSRPVFLAFAEGRRYRLYRAPASRVLLTAEPEPPDAADTSSAP